MRYDCVGEGVPLLLVPGLGCDARMWGAVLDHMEVPARALVPRIWECDSVALAADAVAEALAAEGWSRPFAAGLSMGGYVLFSLLERHPGALGGAVFCDSTAYADTPERRAKRDQTLSLLVAGKFDEVLEAFADSAIWNDGPRGPLAREGLLEMCRTLGSDAFARQSRMIRNRGEFSETLRSADLPLRFLAGDHDAFTPFETAKKMAAEAKRADALLIPDSGHMSALENPRAVAAALDDFLRSRLAPA